MLCHSWVHLDKVSNSAGLNAVGTRKTVRYVVGRSKRTWKQIRRDGKMAEMSQGCLRNTQGDERDGALKSELVGDCRDKAEGELV